MKLAISSILLGVLLSIDASRADAATFSRDAIQTVYQSGVPHTNKTGALRTTYDPNQSFFQIGMWGTPLHGYEQGYNYDWQQLKNAGFNTAWTWYKPAVSSLQSGWSNDMQVVLMGEAPTNDLGIIATNPNLRNRLLGTAWADEPTTQTPLNQMQSRYNSFLSYRQTLQSILPNSPVFVTDAPAFANGATYRQWWETWASGGDLTSQDNYPLRPDVTSIGRISPPGIPESISLATSTLNQAKPVWAIISAYETANPNDSFPQRFATAVQMRAQVYSAVIHGATGIVYFTWDSLIGRHSDNLGIAPNPPADGYSSDPGYYEATMTADQIARSTAAWNAAAATNLELQSLAPAILSPTVSQSDLTYSLSISNLSAPNNSTLYSDTPIRTMLKKDPDGRYVLMAVNLDGRSMDVGFNFAKQFADYDLLFENDGGFFNNLGTASAFTYHFDPYATHIFRLQQHLTSWSTNRSGDWAAGGNWAGGSPNGIGATAQFLNVIASPQTIFTNTPVKVGTLKFDSGQTYLLAGNGSLTIDVASGSGSIQVLQGSHKINLPLTFADSTTIDVSSGGALTIADPWTLASGITVSKNGNGSLTLLSTLAATGPATIKVNGGTVNLAGATSNHNVTLDIDPATVNVGASQSLGAVNLVAGGNQLRVGRAADGNITAANLTVKRLTASGGGIDTIETAGDDNIVTVNNAFEIGAYNTVIKSGPGTLRVAAGAVQNHAAGATLRATAGHVIVDSPSQGNLAISAENGANITLNASQRLSTIAMNSGGAIDLRDRALILTNASAGTWNPGQGYVGVAGLIAQGRNGGAWNGPGLQSSLAAEESGLTTIAIASNADLGKTSFAGASVGADDVLVMYTYAGDADLSGAVNADDYFRIDSGYARGATGFSSGDFDYNGTINADDYFLIDLSYAGQQARIVQNDLSSIAGVSVVPEPASLSAAVVAMIFANCTRRRAKSL